MANLKRLVKFARRSTKDIGNQAELDACEFLRERGLKLVKKNFYGKGGEIDLIMQDGNYLVFVEVRLRHDADHGHSLESITRSKQLKIIKTAIYYLQKENLLDKVDCRFDVIAFDPQNKIIWIKNAFEVQY